MRAFGVGARDAHCDGALCPDHPRPSFPPLPLPRYEDHLRRFAGWAHAHGHAGGAPLEAVTLAMCVPSAARDAAGPAMQYADWLAKARGASPHTVGLAVRSIMAAAKCLYHDVSASEPRDGDKAYADLGVVKELRAMSKEWRTAGRLAPRAADEKAKWLEWDEYLELVAELKRECAGRDETGRARSPAAVAWSLQRYLVAAMLACVPDRQRTLRELEVGRTLVWEGGRWVIRHGPDDYKTGRAYGERPPLVLAPSLYPELGAFLDHWRAHLKPSHGLVFSTTTGGPLTGQALHKMFQLAAHRLTGQKTNPHLVRDMVVTHLRGGDATERELEALALYMGHSVEMQRQTYDRRTKADKVEPAVGLLERLNEGLAA